MYSDDVLVQPPAVRIDESDSEAGGAGREPRFGRTQEPDTALRIRLDCRVEQIRADIAGKHQEDHEKAAMHICPKQRERNQPRQQLGAARLFISAGGPLRYVQCDDEKKQSKKMGPCQPVNRAAPRCQ